MTKQTYHDGDLTHSKITITSIDGSKSVDMTNQCHSIDIFESIISPIVKAELHVYDAIDLLQTFPIQGEEYVEFSFKTSTLEKDVKCKFVVVSVDQISIDQSNRSKSYVIKLTSEELYNSQKQLVQKKYKQTTVDIVKDILKTNLSTKKTLYNDATKGIEDITLVHKKPFQALDLLRRRAVSTKYKSSSFCFYESLIHPGYYFRTLESIFNASAPNVGDRQYKYFTNTSESILISNFRNILSYEHVNLAATVNQIQHGGLRNRVTSLDLVTGKLDNYDYTNEQYQKIDAKGQDLHTGSFASKYGDDIATWYFTAIDSSLPHYELPEKIGQLQGFIQNIVSSLLHIHVYGDSGTGVGDVISVNLPDAVGSTAPASSKMISGNYLIAKCRHMLVFGKYKNYTQSMELIKGSYLGG